MMRLAATLAPIAPRRHELPWHTVRGGARFDRDIRAGTWHYTSTGRIPRASHLTVGILGLGRIGNSIAAQSSEQYCVVDAYRQAGLSGGGWN